MLLVLVAITFKPFFLSTRRLLGLAVDEHVLYVKFATTAVDCVLARWSAIVL